MGEQYGLPGLKVELQLSSPVEYFTFPVSLQPERSVPIPGRDQAGDADEHLSSEL